MRLIRCKAREVVGGLDCCTRGVSCERVGRVAGDSALSLLPSLPLVFQRMEEGEGEGAGAVPLFW